MQNPTPSEIKTVLTILKKSWPNPGAMHLDDPFRTIVGVLLSARTRDEQVLALLPAFFKAFPNPQMLAKASVAQIEARISTIGMFHQKAKNLKSLATDLVNRFGGEVPCIMDELVSLAGVGRKTASVVLTVCFNHSAIAVDTHVFRIVNRLGWVKEKTPEKTESALLKIIPEPLQNTINSVMVKHGRYVCLPGKPRCWMCPIAKHCAFKGKRLVAPKDANAIREDIARREASLEDARITLIS